MTKVFFIAEAGVNHNGSEKLAKKLIDIAAISGADAVKFQTFKADQIVSRRTKKASYQITSKHESQYAMIKKLELSFATFERLRKHAKKKKIKFMSTPFDIESLSFLDKKLNLQTLKIPSGEITNAPLLLKFAQTKKKLILSTGMSNLNEIENALQVLSYGFLNAKNKKIAPSKEKFLKAYVSKRGKKYLSDKVILLHCTSEYPTALKDVNLNAMNTLKKKFGLKVGYSDHSNSLLVPCAAAAMGACVIEKHFTISKKMSGPDHRASLSPAELKKTVSSIRSIEIIAGSTEKVATRKEIGNKHQIRKYLVANRNIKKGQLFDYDNIVCKRAGKGIDPINYWSLIGQKSPKNFKIDDVIKLND